MSLHQVSLVTLTVQCHHINYLKHSLISVLIVHCLYFFIGEKTPPINQMTHSRYSNTYTEKRWNSFTSLVPWYLCDTSFGNLLQSKLIVLFFEQLSHVSEFRQNVKQKGIIKYDSYWLYFHTVLHIQDFIVL